MKRSKIVVLGHILNPISDTKCEYFKNGVMVLSPKTSKDKTVYYVEQLGHKRILSSLSEGFQLVDYSDHVIIPSFFDMHFHWVQDDVREMPKANLLTWLDNYTFPTEKKFKNKTYAKKRANEFFSRLASVGTLGGACYSSIHEHACEYAIEKCIGDFTIGNVLMTQNSPKYLSQTKDNAVEIVKRLSSKYKSKYALTPRFAIATDAQTMKETSKIAKKNKSFMQSHLCETQNEIDFVKSLYKEVKGFEKVKSYTEIYKKVGMLGPNCIMGHGIHLMPEEIEMLAKTKTAIAHCPTSNAPIKEKGLGSGLFDFKRIEKNNIRWALGSDIGGGPVLSMFDVMRSFVDQNAKANVKGATYKKALYRATLAGAKLLKLDKKKGNLSVGKEANFLVLPKLKADVEPKVESILAQYIGKHKRQRIKYDQMLEKVYFQGQVIHSK